MTVETWYRRSLREQEQITGRHKGSGAPLSPRGEHDPLDVGASPENSPVALTYPDTNGGHKILRRGYSFGRGSVGLGHLDAGLFFVAFGREARTQHVPLQRRLSSDDLMS
jgi:deferrochelatase/peroxidase EfeB